MQLTVKIFLTCLAFWLTTPRATANNDAVLASPAEIETAVAVFTDWTKAYMEKDFVRQWHLTDPRIRKWQHRKRWVKAMRKSFKKTGVPTSVSIKSATAIDPASLPCTEMGHCYRKGVQVIVLLLNTRYKDVSPQQPEYAIMSKSTEGWRFGGGTYPNLPLGETMVILNKQDEARYKPDFTMN